MEKTLPSLPAIIIIAGTNGMVTKELIDEHIQIIRESAIVMMQLEIRKYQPLSAPEAPAVRPAL